MKLPDFVAAFARATPEREAVFCDGVRLSFGELHEQSTRVALGLAGHGVQVGDRVAICLTNRIEYVVAFLACIKAGAIAVTLNPRYAAAELAYMLADAGVKAAFFEDETRGSVTRSGVKIPVPITCDAPREPGEIAYASLLASTGRLPEIPPAFDDCQIQYTSGTTGKAKGAIITQANYVVANGYFNLWLWGMTAADRVLTTTPLAHRTAFSRLMNTFTIGSSIVVMKRFDAQEAARLIEAENITLLGMVPTVGRMLLPEIEANPGKFRNLRLAVVTGEAFPVEVKRRLARALPHLKLVSFFAMTESGAITCLGPDPQEQIDKAASVGRVVPGIEVKLVDDDGKEVAPGETGEIAVRTGVPGNFVTMRAYFNKPEATAQTIRDGWLHTGDLGRMDEDGYLYIVDRKKDMVLSGGYNIYSKEVESAILELPGVQDVAVVGVPDEIYGESVAAFIELAPAARLEAARVIEHCREKMASYKKPKHVRFVEALPRNSSGKVLKFQLREQFKRMEEAS